MVIIPQWTERISNRDVVGEDHLGIETAAVNYQGELLPGIITVTDHARYYSLYCWILWQFIQDERHDRRIANLRGVYFKRLELAHTIACYAHHQDDKDLGGVIGSQRSGVIWREGDPVDLDGNVDRYFQNTLGGFGQYYLTPMRVMGLIGEQPNRSDVYQLTERGLELAKAYDASVNQTRYYSALQHSDVSLLWKNDAEDYGETGCLCADALSQGADRDLLRDALFRLDDGQEIKSWHRERQLSLALLLDMVRQADGLAFREVMRHGLYLGDFAKDVSYEPLTAFLPTYERWRHVQTRQLYTNALQILWSVFLKYLQDETVNDGILFDDFIGWLDGQYPAEIIDTPIVDYVQEMMQASGFIPDWRNCGDYVEQNKFARDALTLFNFHLDANKFTAQQALDMLIDVFLRFYHLHASENEVWQELAVGREESHRLPMRDFFHTFESFLENGRTLHDVLFWLYQDYILSQHEYMAIRKLRYNGYDTFKFHYTEGKFYRTGKRYDQPLRHPALRLNNALTMLIDVGLIEDKNGLCRLSRDGEVYLQQVEELNHGH